MEEAVKNIFFQAGFAGLLLLGCYVLFSRLMRYIEGKDDAHERDRKARDERFLTEFARWREDIGKALANNTKAMVDLTGMIEHNDSRDNERFHATDKRLDAILENMRHRA